MRECLHAHAGHWSKQHTSHPIECEFIERERESDGRKRTRVIVCGPVRGVTTGGGLCRGEPMEVQQP